MKKTQLKSLLISSGLSSKEALIYMFLLEKGSVKASTIFKSFPKLKKGNTYALLDKLEKKKLVTKKGVLFEPLPPQNLLTRLKKKTQNLKNSLKYLEESLPELTSKYKLSVGKPTIKYFEGLDGIKDVFEDIYSPKEVVYGCVDLEQADKALPAYIVNKLIPKRIKNQVKAISFVADSKQARQIKKDDQNQLRETHLVDQEKYPLPAEIDVYEDKIAMLTFTKGDFLGLLIENEDLATTLKSIFRLALDSREDSSD